MAKKKAKKTYTGKPGKGDWSKSGKDYHGKIRKKRFAPGEIDALENEVLDFAKLSPEYKKRREAFAREYIKDFNAVRAAMRMGMSYESASANAHKLLDDTYTIHCLDHLRAALDESAIVSRADVLLGLVKEANFAHPLLSTHSARISAWKQLSKVLGMEVNKLEVSGSLQSIGGVMRIPAPQSVDKWEESAAASQAELKAKVKE